MAYFVIQGGRPLKGAVRVRGSKNAASKMMVASLLTDEPCVLENVPFSAEIDITRELCENIGSKVSLDTGDAAHCCVIETKGIARSLVSELSRRNRIPILALGPLLHRSGIAEVPFLGGDPIGHRPIDFHLAALLEMGVKIERKERSWRAEASRIEGARIAFPFPSVGATENVLFTAVLAKGRTVIRNAAVEPEIIATIGMLRQMGADIVYDVSRREIAIEGVRRLGRARVRVLPDRNEMVSFAAAALATGGDIVVHEATEEYVGRFCEKVREIGGVAEPDGEGIRFFAKGPFMATAVETAPHPGFMTDWQQPFCVVLTQAEGESILHETVYEDRFGYVKDLRAMGADIVVSDECGNVACRWARRTFNHRARIRGPVKLRGTYMAMTDIRAGMAHLIAALAAEGESVISGVEHIDRGYEKIDERLRELGADIRRI